MIRRLLFALVFTFVGVQAQAYQGDGASYLYPVTPDMIPTAAIAIPPCVADAGALGSNPTVFAMANHTHCSKARKGIVTTATDGTVTVTFGTPFGAGVVPICVGQAVPPAGTTNVINAQGDGDPTNTSAKFRVTVTSITTVALLGLNILSVPASPGATKLHYLCVEP